MKSPPIYCFLLLAGFIGATIVTGDESADRRALFRKDEEGAVDTATSVVNRVIRSPAENGHCDSCGKRDCNCHDNRTRFLRGRGGRRTGAGGRGVLRVYPSSRSHGSGKATRIVYIGLGTHGLGGRGKGVFFGGTYGLEGISGAGLGKNILIGGTHGIGGILGSSGFGTYGLGENLGFSGLGNHGFGGIVGAYGHGTHGLGGLVSSSGHGIHGLGGLLGSSGLGTHGLRGLVTSSSHGLGGLVTSSAHGLGGIVDTYGHGIHGLGGLFSNSGVGGISGHSKGLIDVAKFPGSAMVHPADLGVISRASGGHHVSAHH